MVSQSTVSRPTCGWSNRLCRERLAETLGAARVQLSAEQLAAIEAAMPADQVAGTRYAEDQMAMLDSEG